MTDELKQRITPEIDAERVVENPVDELARIMGYNNDQAPVAEPVMAESTTAADLEAELMREFGIDSLALEPEEPVVSDVQVPEQSNIEQEAPVIPVEQPTYTRQPMEQPNYQPVNAPDDVLAEMVQYNIPTPVENAVTNDAVPIDNNVQLDGDNFANELELELAKLQQGLSDGMGTGEALPQEFPTMSNHEQEVHAPPVSPAFETSVSSVVVEIAEPVLQPALENETFVADMSEVIETDNDVEPTIEFDIPSVEPVNIAVEPETAFDADLDSELEREFSQMFADETLRADEPNPNQPAPEELEPAPQDDINSFFDMTAMNEEKPEAVPEADVAPILMQPERIDVSKSQNNWQDFQATPIAGSSSSGKFAAVGIFAFLILGVGGYFIYNNLTSEGSGSSEPIVIKADNSPIKEEPADPGGTSVPNQDLAVYNQVEGNDTSIANQPSLLEATEEPVDIVQRTLDPSLLPLEGRELTDKVEDRLVSGDQTSVASTDGGARPLIVPRKVRTVVVQADGTIITREEPVSPQPTQTETQPIGQTFSNQGASSEVTGAQPSVPPINQEVATALENAAQSSANAPSENQTNTQAAAVVPTAQATQPPATTTAAAQPVENFTGYYMQIASQPSLAAAQSSYQNLVGRYNSVLGGRGVEYQKADIAGKGTFHRVRIQVGERSEANSLCSRYKSAGGSCFVTR